MRRQPSDASGERTEPSHPGPRLSHPMVHPFHYSFTSDPRLTSPPSRATQAHGRQFDGIVSIVSVGAGASERLLSSRSMACESDSAQAAKQRMMQSDAAQLMWRQCRNVVPERAANDPIRAGCELAALAWVGKIRSCMMHARGGAVLSLRWAEGLICCWVCCADSMMACSRALFCLCHRAACRAMRSALCPPLDAGGVSVQNSEPAVRLRAWQSSEESVSGRPDDVRPS